MAEALTTHGPGRRIVNTAILLLLAGVFLYAGAIKAIAPDQLAVDISHYRLAPAWAIGPLAFYLPWIEIAAGLALLWRPLRRGGCLVIAVLLLVFIAATASAWLRGLDIRCGCFGAASGATGNHLWSIGRNLLLLAGVAFIAWQAVLRPQAEKGYW